MLVPHGRASNTIPREEGCQHVPAESHRSSRGARDPGRGRDAVHGCGSCKRDLAGKNGPILFAGGDAGSGSGLWSTQANGTRLRHLTSNPTDSEVQTSPVRPDPVVCPFRSPGPLHSLRQRRRRKGSRCRTHLQRPSQWQRLSHAPIRSRHRSSNAAGDRTTWSARRATSNVGSARRAEDGKSVDGHLREGDTGTQFALCSTGGVIGRRAGQSPRSARRAASSERSSDTSRSRRVRRSSAGWSSSALGESEVASSSASLDGGSGAVSSEVGPSSCS